METDFYLNIDEVDELLEQTPDKKFHVNKKNHKLSPYNDVIMDQELEDNETPPDAVPS
jgi:hypothetical protein